jgi:bacterial/archaeal transporter family protein
VQSRSWLLFAVLSAVFASLTSIFGKIGVENVESNLGTAIRTVVVLAMAWLMVFVSGKQYEIKGVSKKSWVFLFLSGITTGLSWLCYYRALQDGPASAVVPIDKLSIVVTIVFSYAILKERLSRKAVVGLLLILVGTGAMLF